jgi:arylsulfatase A-like enzyme
MTDAILNRRSLLASAAAVMFTAAGGAVLAQTSRKPNFIIILCDDMGFGDIGPFGNTVIPTPNLDRMAREGALLTDYYAPANVCTPSRAGMLTGRQAPRVGLPRVLQPVDTIGLPASERTIATLLKPAGYKTALFGKWHLGHTGEHWPPTKFGYDHFYGLPYSHDQVPNGLFEADAGSDEIKSEPLDFKWEGVFKTTVETNVDFTSQIEYKLAAQAERFIEANRGGPFYVQLNISTPHLPEIPSAAFKGKSKAGPYGDTIMDIDAIVGHLLGRLREWKLEKDTLVIFTSDNGPWYWGSAGGLRDRKAGAGYDGGYHVPCIAWRPGWVPAGKRVTSVVSGMDFLPTFCAMAGVAVPTDRPIDGVNVTEVLHSGAPTPREELVLLSGTEVSAIRTDRWKYVALRQATLFGYDELYDMRADPSESYNVKLRHPDVVADMRKRFARAQAEFKQYAPATAPARAGAPPSAVRN